MLHYYLCTHSPRGLHHTVTTDTHLHIVEVVSVITQRDSTPRQEVIRIKVRGAVISQKYHIILRYVARYLQLLTNVQ